MPELWALQVQAYACREAGDWRLECHEYISLVIEEIGKVKEPGEVNSPLSVPDAPANVHEALHVSFIETVAEPLFS